MKKLKIVGGGCLIAIGFFDCIDIVMKTKPLNHPHPMQDILGNIVLIIAGVLLLRWGLKSHRIEF